MSFPGHTKELIMYVTSIIPFARRFSKRKSGLWRGTRSAPITYISDVIPERILEQQQTTNNKNFLRLEMVIHMKKRNVNFFGNQIM